MPYKYTHIIWDFNGTILDDVELGINCVNTMLQARSLPRIQDTPHYRRIMKFPIIDYYRDLGFDFDKEDYYTILAPEWVSLYMAGEHTCGLMPHIPETLQAIKDMGIPQIILSASHRDQLITQLSRLGITHYFDEILGLDNIFAKSKTILAKDFLARHPEAKPLCIGDTNHDAQLMQVMGADGLLYTGGHQDRARLEACGLPMIDDVGEILGYLK